MNTLELLSANIPAYRKKLGLTQVVLAQKANITKKHLLNIEKGRILPSANILDNIAKALGVNVGRLFQEPTEREERIQKIYETYDQAIDSSMGDIREVLLKALKDHLD